MLSTWELFRDEIDRNISPNIEMIEQQLLFLVERNICNQADFSKITKVRLMASHEQAISEYLHNRGIYRQASLKAETVFLASTIEYLLEKLLNFYVATGIVAQGDFDNIFPKYPMFTTFSKLIKSIQYFPDFPDDLKKDIDELRDERNKVHIDAYCLDNTRLFHEEFKVVKFRKVFDGFISYIKEHT